MIVSTFALLGIDSGFTAMSSSARVPSEFAVHTLLDNFSVEPSTDKDSRLHNKHTRFNGRGRVGHNGPMIPLPWPIFPVCLIMLPF